MVLENIKLSFEYDRQVELKLNSENKMLLIDLLLTTVDDIPKLKKVAYIKSKNEFKETYHTETSMKKKYDNIIYQIVSMPYQENYRILHSLLKETVFLYAYYVHYYNLDISLNMKMMISLSGTIETRERI